MSAQKAAVKWDWREECWAGALVVVEVIGCGGKGCVPRGGFCMSDLATASEARRRSVWRILSSGGGKGRGLWECERACAIIPEALVGR